MRVKIQWGSEYQPFKYWKHLNTQLFEVRISNGQLILDPPFEYRTIWHPTSFRSFKYQTSSVFRSPLETISISECGTQKSCGCQASMSVFALWPVIFYKNVLIFSKKLYFSKAYFSYFYKSYLSVSTTKYNYKMYFNFNPSCTSIKETP